jgi:hypothetical protein
MKKRRHAGHAELLGWERRVSGSRGGTGPKRQALATAAPHPQAVLRNSYWQTGWKDDKIANGLAVSHIPFDWPAPLAANASPLT